MTFAKAAELTAEAAESNNRLLFSSLVAAVQQFLPHMLQSGSGAIITALAAQRHYLTSLEKEVASAGVFVGRIYISGLIRGNAIDEMMRKARGPEAKEIPGMGSPDDLAAKLWGMHQGGRKHEAVVPRFGKAMTRMMASKSMQKRMQKAAG